MKKEKQSIPFFDNRRDKAYEKRQIVIGILAVILSLSLLVLLNGLNSIFSTLVPSNEAWALAFLALPFSIFSIYLSVLLHNKGKDDIYILGKKYNIAYDYFTRYRFKLVFECSVVSPVLYICLGLFSQKFELLIGGALMLTIVLCILTTFEYKKSSSTIVDIYYKGFTHYIKQIAHNPWENEELFLLEKSVREHNYLEEKKIMQGKTTEFFFALQEMKVEKSFLTESQEKEMLCALANSCSPRTLDLCKLKNICFYDYFLEKMSEIINQIQKDGKTLSADKLIVHLLLQFGKFSIHMNNELQKNEKKIGKILPHNKNKKVMPSVLNWLKEVAKIRFIFSIYKRVCDQIEDLISKMSEPSLWKEYIDSLQKMIDVNHSVFARVDSKNQEIIAIVSNSINKIKSGEK